MRAVVAFALACGLALLAAPALGQDPSQQSPAENAAAKQAAEDAKPKKKPVAPAPPAPDIVRVGGLINDIQQLDLQSHSYNVDMYIWFKWKNPDINPAKSFEFLNAFELWGHITTQEYSHPVELPDGSLYQVIRNQGKFNTKLPLEEYPFDTQNLRVVLEDSSADSTPARLRSRRRGSRLDQRRPRDPRLGDR